MNAMEFVDSGRGGVKLCYDGYMYTKKSVTKCLSVVLHVVAVFVLNYIAGCI